MKSEGRNVASTDTTYAVVVPTTTSVFMSVRRWRAAESAPR
jgi:hypothetical protein